VNRAPGKPLAPPMREFLLYALSREGQRAVAADRMKFIPLDAAQAAAAREQLASGDPAVAAGRP